MKACFVSRVVLTAAVFLAATEVYAQYPVGTARGFGSAGSAGPLGGARSSGRQFGATNTRGPLGLSTGSGRSFGSSGRGSFGPRPGGLGSFNRPQQNQSPALSNYLNLLGGNNTFEGQYFLRTQPFDDIESNQRKFGQNFGSLQNEVGAIENSVATGTTNSGIVPIASGLTTTGHPVGFLSTGNYFPRR